MSISNKKKNNLFFEAENHVALSDYAGCKISSIIIIRYGKVSINSLTLEDK